VFNEGFFTQTLNHFGSASKGSVIAETWAEDGFNASNQEVNTQGVVRAILLPKALRVSAKVQLFGVDASDNEHLLASSSTVNSQRRPDRQGGDAGDHPGDPAELLLLHRRPHGDPVERQPSLDG
jgi:hypothetical protein